MPYKFSARPLLLGFDDRYVAHPRSRWHGNPYWIVANPDAVPERVREKCHRILLSPARIAAVVKPAQAALSGDHAFAIEEFGEPVTYRSSWARVVRLDHAVLGASLLSVAVCAYFLDWIERHVPAEGEWWMTASGLCFHARGQQINAVLMPMRVPYDDVLRVNGREAA